MSATTESSHVPPASDVRVYKLPNSYTVIGSFGLLIFLAATVLGIALPLANPDGSFARSVLAAIVAGIFFSGLTILSIYLLAACWRERLYVSSQAVRIVGVFRTKTVLFA